MRSPVIGYMPSEPGIYEGLRSPSAVDRRRLFSLIPWWEREGFKVVRWQPETNCDLIYIVSLPHSLQATIQLLSGKRDFALVAGILEDPFYGNFANCFSDDIVDLKRISFYGTGWRALLRRVRWMLSKLKLASDPLLTLFNVVQQCDGIITSSDCQAALIRQLNVFAEGVADCIPDSDLGGRTCSYEDRVPVSIVWEGTRWGLQLLELVRPALEVVHRRSSVPVEFLMVADRVRPTPFFGLTDNEQILKTQYKLPTRFVDWKLDSIGELLCNAAIGIAPMPLRNPFYLNKAWSKPLVYMACGLPVVASPIPSYRQLIRHGLDGFLPKTLEEWTEVLLDLICSPQLREKIGLAGRRRLEEINSTEMVANRFSNVFREALRLHQATPRDPMRAQVLGK